MCNTSRTADRVEGFVAGAIITGVLAFVFSSSAQSHDPEPESEYVNYNATTGEAYNSYYVDPYFQYHYEPD